MIRSAAIIFLLLSFLKIQAQKDTLRPAKEKYDRKEEIIYDGKLYRKYNNYATFGAGYLGTSNRKDISKNIGVDFQFHIRRQHFQAGLNMSGSEFMSNNNVQGHLGYGFRKEKNTVNYAVVAGLSFFYGVLAIEDSTYGTIPYYYSSPGVYFSAQAVTKFTYDIGIGIEGFGEYSPEQRTLGIKFILFFSGSYRGPKKNFNPHVKAENRK